LPSEAIGFELLAALSGGDLGGSMKQPKLSDLLINRKGTKDLRARMSKAKKIKITINVDEDSLSKLKSLAEDTGTPYQKLLNQVLKEGLASRSTSESRLDRIERELEKLKKKIAA
jgi:predicted DNA binding CopG/RHH family protein